MIDYGRLKLDERQAEAKLELEKQKDAAEIEQKLVEAYLKATETAEPEIWTRKLRVLENLATDAKTREWAHTEATEIKDHLAREAVYREALKVASQLVDRNSTGLPETQKAKGRFNQLYWQTCHTPTRARTSRRRW